MSKIEWCDKTWNWLVGCSRMPNDPACVNCYAATAAASPRLQQFSQYQGVQNWDGTVNFAESQLYKPLEWKSPQRIFTCSMSDVFHSNVPDEWRDRAFAVMAVKSQHTYQVLTKRTVRMLDYFSNPELGKRWIRVIEEDKKLMTSPCLGHLFNELEESVVLSQLWLGTTATCQKTVGDRLPILDKLSRKGFTTFVSVEPLTEAVNLGLDFPGYKIHQVITGAESGKNARSMKQEWVRSLRDQCLMSNVAFFYKQDFVRSRKVSLPKLDGATWTQFPEDS